jgi:hypothetical protein
LNFTIPADATEAFIRFRNGSGVPGEVVMWTDVVLVEGDYTGDYFDGSSGPGFTWNGIPDASTSTVHADVRQADCECLTAIDFSTFGADPTGRFAVELQNLNAYWADTYDTTVVLPVNAYAMPGFDGASAPLDDAVITVTGPVTNPRVSDYIKGSYVQYNGVVAAGQTLVIDASAFTVTGTGGLTPALADLQIVGMTGRMFRLVPDSISRGYQAALTGSATTAATTLTVVGRRKYLVG